MLCQGDTCYKGNVKLLFANNPLCNTELRMFTGPTDLGAFFYILGIVLTLTNTIP